jgi:serine/threonine protein kinase
MAHLSSNDQGFVGQPSQTVWPVPDGQESELPFGSNPEFTPLPSAAQGLLDDLLDLQLLAPHAVEVFFQENADRLHEFTQAEDLARSLIQAGLLTPYQYDRYQAGTTYGLVLGNYRVLERLGGGSVSVVFLGEHLHMKRRVAIKVLPVDDDFPLSVLERFYAEMRVLADLHHPNIVLAFDAGQLAPPAPGMPALHYLVMELVAGGDLEQFVLDHGPVPVAQACEWIRQAACGLQEAHDRHLIHRDVKPSNMLLSPQGEVKLVDFGLARQFCSRLTEPTALLGSVEFMAPEQSRDPTAVAGPADIYGLGASLFWLLTGELPYPPQPTIAEALRSLQQKPPRRARSLRPEVPAELDDLIARMMERDPARRPASPLAVMNALLRFSTAASETPARNAEVDLPRATSPGCGKEPAPPAGQVRVEQLAHQLLRANRQLEHSLAARTQDTLQAQYALVFAMAKLAEASEGETAGHVLRLQRYCRCLAEQAAAEPSWKNYIDGPFLERLELCVPLHDIGKLALPDALLAKSGPFTAYERALMKTHTLHGVEILDALNRQYGATLPLLAVATVIVRYHHERYDGQGYPDRLEGEAIPPAARLVALADTYDALRRQRPHKRALSHAEATRVILHESGGQFDPALVRAFGACHPEFERIFQDVRA